MLNKQKPFNNRPPPKFTASRTVYVCLSISVLLALSPREEAPRNAHVVVTGRDQHQMLCALVLMKS